jgi:LysM domain
MRPMTRTRVRWDRLAVLAAVLAGSLALAGRASGGLEAVPALSGDRYEVRRGDTLWEIARTLVGPQEDPRPVVEAIRDANGIGTGPLLPGERLFLPAP